jgi:hypothetical protein
MIKFLTAKDALAEINPRLGTPITRQQFNIPWRLLVQREGGTVAPRQRSFVSSQAVQDLCLYMRTRENMIAAGEWSKTHPYDMQDFDDVVSGGFYESYQPEEKPGGN